MMRRPFFLLSLFVFAVSASCFGQRIVYSEPHNDDTRRMNFEIVGKVTGNFLIYKHIRGKSFFSVYDGEMKELNRQEHDYLPDDRLINSDFFPYNDFVYMVYQYQKKNVVYCNAVKIDGMGKKMGEVITLDTTHISSFTNNKLYSVVSSENKSKLMVFKINSKNKSRFIVSTVLFDDALNLQKRSRFLINMDENDDYLDDFSVDNDGDFVFLRFNRNSNETINRTDLFFKASEADTVQRFEVAHKDILLDDIHLKVDNSNKRYLLTSFYYTKKRGNIEGFYFYVWDKLSRQPSMQQAVVLGDEIRKEARGDANMKMAFNDYFVRNVIIRKDGGFLINTESYYTTSRSNNWNRWNYLYGMPMTSWDYYNLYSPGYNSWWWRDRFNNQNVRRHADNITVLSFNPDGKLEWSSVIHKEQFDDESDDRISYITANRGNQIHYLFNIDERRGLFLNDFTLSPDGQVAANPTLKNLDRGYEFMPKYGKQVSANQLIIPCFYRNYICFAKLEFN
jgi:hypothetical protein